MAKQVPAYIKEEARKLNTALISVKKHASAIEKWVDEQTDADSMDFFYENKLDNPYEFVGFHGLLKALNEAVEQ